MRLVRRLEGPTRSLRERLPEVEAAERCEDDTKVRSYTRPYGKDLDLVRRYGTANDKQLHKAIDRSRQVQADRRAAEAAAVEGDHLLRREDYETKPPRRTSRRNPGCVVKAPSRCRDGRGEVAMEAKIKRAALPSEKILNRILRYEAANDRQLHRT